jgi:hypothetical protein
VIFVQSLGCSIKPLLPNLIAELRKVPKSQELIVRSAKSFSDENSPVFSRKAVRHADRMMLKISAGVVCALG